jgi:hypothetical protein
MTVPGDLRKHTLLESIAYHLIPGVMVGLAYYLLAPVVREAGYPTVMALNLTAILVLIPVELGILFWQGRQRNGRWSLDGILAYQDPLPWWGYMLWVLVIFVASGLIMTLFTPVNDWLAGWFAWIPENLRVGMGLSAAFSRGKLIQTYAAFFFLVVIGAPAVEELYFRGFLLPRLPEKLGWGAPLVHSLLFALYHIWSPWMFLARTVALLPLIFVVRWKKNLLLAILAHWLINAIDLIMAVVFILGMGG